MNPDGIHVDIPCLKAQEHPLKHPGRRKAVGVGEEKEYIKDIFKWRSVQCASPEMSSSDPPFFFPGNSSRTGNRAIRPNQLLEVLSCQVRQELEVSLQLSAQPDSFRYGLAGKEPDQEPGRMFGDSETICLLVIPVTALQV